MALPPFLWLSSTVVYIRTTFFFIHSPVSGRLGSVRVLAIVNSAAMTTEVQFIF